MKIHEHDILAERPEIKKLPYSIPEEYFNEFKTSAYRLSGAGKAARGQRRAGIFISAAASVAAVLILGAYFIFGFGDTDDFTQEDFLVFDPSIINTEYYAYTENIADAEIVEEDIIEYLIYNGISLEEIESNIK